MHIAKLKQVPVGRAGMAWLLAMGRERLHLQHLLACSSAAAPAQRRAALARE